MRIEISFLVCTARTTSKHSGRFDEVILFEKSSVYVYSGPHEEISFSVKILYQIIEFAASLCILRDLFFKEMIHVADKVIVVVIIGIALA